MYHKSIPANSSFTNTIQRRREYNDSSGYCSINGCRWNTGAERVLERWQSSGLLTYVTALYGPMETLAYLSSSYASASARARRVLEVLDTDQEVVDAPGAQVLPAHIKGGGGISFKGVNFGYERSRTVLHDISLEVQPGETIALVGPTGAGKTTLVSLIPRFLIPGRDR